MADISLFEELAEVLYEKFRRIRGKHVVDPFIRDFLGPEINLKYKGSDELPPWVDLSKGDCYYWESLAREAVMYCFNNKSEIEKFEDEVTKMVSQIAIDNGRRPS